MGLARNVEVRIPPIRKTVGLHILQVGRDTLVEQAASMLILIRSCRSWGGADFRGFGVLRGCTRFLLKGATLLTF